MSIMLMVTKQDGLDQADADAVEASLKELQVEDGDFVCKVGAVCRVLPFSHIRSLYALARIHTLSHTSSQLHALHHSSMS